MNIRVIEKFDPVTEISMVIFPEIGESFDKVLEDETELDVASDVG